MVTDLLIGTCGDEMNEDGEHDEEGSWKEDDDETTCTDHDQCNIRPATIQLGTWWSLL